MIEPDISLAKSISKYLSANYLVNVAYDAQSAVRLADENTPDMIILELAMPKNNGLAFLQELRSYNDWSKIPVLIYSQIPREDVGLSDQDWQKHGVVAYLYKSTKSLASLSEQIRNNLNNYEAV